MLAIVLGVSLAAALEAAEPERPATPAQSLLPVPLHVESDGGALPIDRGFTTAWTGADDPRVAAALQRSVARLEKRLGHPLPAPRRAAQARLVVEAASAGLPVQSVSEDESYRLVVTPREARLTAATPLGIVHGLATFEQLVVSEGGRAVVTAVKIEDRPRFAWRGLLLDPCRRWEPVEVITRTLDAMAAVKLNVLHWHLSEDQGFRIESKRWPRLQEMGSEGHYYTQDQVRSVVAYARERGIRVVPEFDTPGHSTSWLVGYPELGAFPGPFELVREWGIFDNVLDPTRDRLYEFLDAFFGEMAGLFPDEYVHIGGDEVMPRQWNASLPVLDFMYQHRLRDARDLQAYYNRRINEVLARHGKKMMGWDEVLHPDLPRSILVQSWRGPEGLAQAARQGCDTILSDGYYLDHMLPAAQHYGVDPLPAGRNLSPEESRHVLGGEACMWGEFVTPENIDARLWPRAAAVAERLWSPAEVKDVDDLYRRLEIQDRRLTDLGLTQVTSYTPRLQRLVGAHPVEPLQRLADLVHPVRFYRRGHMRSYTTATPLDRLVDVARPDSAPARAFRRAVDRLLLQPPAQRSDVEVRATLTAWRDNHAVLDPILADSPQVAEARTLSRDLQELGSLGLRCLDGLAAGQAMAPERQAEEERLLDAAERARAEVEFWIIPSLRKLVLATARQAELKTTSVEEWNAALDAVVTRLEAQKLARER
jgi:hexosaminidase